MESKVCYVCGKENLSKDEIGLTKKLLDKNTKRFYCLDCLAEYLEVDTEFLLEKVEEFKKQGCKLF
jgi:predicted nucleic-acid-binding Zn-ribbon protein